MGKLLPNVIVYNISDMLPWEATSASEPDHILAATVRATSLGKLVRDDVLGMILRGEIKAGERINEPDIAGRLGVSRVPVREALRELQGEGLVVIEPNRGARVRGIDTGFVENLFEIRTALEVMMVVKPHFFRA